MTAPHTPQGPPPGAEYRYDDDEISLAELIQKGREWARIIWGERRFVAKVVAVTVSFGLLIAFGSQPEYTASTKILPYRASGSSSGLSGLAGLAGVRLPAGASDQTITADLYPEVAKTLDFRVAVAETPIRFMSLPDPVTPMTYFREIARPAMTDYLRSYTIGLPGRILSAVRPADDPQVRAFPDSVGPVIADYEKDYRGVLGILGERLTVASDKKTFIITISAEMPDRYAAADLVRTASERLMARIIEFEAKKAEEQLRFVQEQTSLAKARLDRVQRDQAILSDRSRGTVSATAQLESQRLQREYSLAFDLYRQFAAELEQARIKKSQDTPVFTVLEQVVVPDVRSSPRRGRILFAALFLGLFGAVAVIACKRIVNVRV